MQQKHQTGTLYCFKKCLVQNAEPLASHTECVQRLDQYRVNRVLIIAHQKKVLPCTTSFWNESKLIPRAFPGINFTEIFRKPEIWNGSILVQLATNVRVSKCWSFPGKCRPTFLSVLNIWRFFVKTITNSYN